MCTACRPLLLTLSLIVAACGRARTESAPGVSATPPAPTESPPASASAPPVDAGDAGPLASDPRPRALKNLVPSDDPDAGNAAPTGLVPDCEEQLARYRVSGVKRLAR